MTPKKRQPRGAYGTPVRSIRCPLDVWERAKVRADQDQVTMSLVIRLLIEGYADGHLKTPVTQLVFGEGNE